MSRVVGGWLVAAGLFLFLWMALASPARGKARGDNWFVTPGGTGDACTRAQPCALHTALGKAGNGDTLYLAKGTYTGGGAAVVTLTRSITLAGGWDGRSTGPLTLDPKRFPTVLDGENQRRGVYVGSGITVTLAGLTITRGNATGLTLDICNRGKPEPEREVIGCGGAVLANNPKTLIIKHSRIANSVAAAYAAADGIGFGGGIALIGGRSVITATAFADNVANQDGDGWGGGLYAKDSNVGIFGSTFRDNAGTMKNGATGYGGGAALYNSGGFAEKNVFTDNRAGPQSGAGGGVAVIGDPSGSVRSMIRDNTFKGNQPDAVALWKSKNGPVVKNNRIIGPSDNAAAAFAAAGRYSAGVKNKRITGSSATVGISVHYGMANTPDYIFPTLVNNIIVGYERAVDVHGSLREPVGARVIHNTLVGRGRGTGIYVGDESLVYVINNIVVGFDVGITNTVPGNSVVGVEGTLFWQNKQDGIRGFQPIDGDPRFRDPARGDYRLRAGSPAIDAVLSAGIPIDFEGQRRPAGSAPDIGADEYWPPSVWLPYVER